MSSPFDDLGITAAMAGDIRGARRFLSFIREQTLTLSISSELPGAVQDRLLSFSREAERLADFMDGFSAGHEQPRPVSDVLSGVDPQGSA